MDYFIVKLPQEQNIAIPLHQIQDVITVKYGEICPIPGVEKSVLGITSQRGNLLWLLDLSLLLQNVLTIVNKLESITVLTTKYSQKTLGLVVKNLGKIQNIDEIEPLASDSLAQLNRSYLSGLTRDDSTPLPILNLASVYGYLT